MITNRIGRRRGASDRDKPGQRHMKTALLREAHRVVSLLLRSLRRRRAATTYSHCLVLGRAAGWRMNSDPLALSQGSLSEVVTFFELEAALTPLKSETAGRCSAQHSRLPGAAPQIDEQNDEHGCGADPDANGDLGAGPKIIPLCLGYVRVFHRGDRAEFRMDDDE